MATYELTQKAGSGNVPLFPRFYFKNAGGRISIYHRFTHCYLECYATDEELAEAMAGWNEISQNDLWEHLLFARHAQLVKPMDFPKRFAHDEDWYLNAWGIYTARFYEKYPELFIEEVEMPYVLAFRLRQAFQEKEHAKHKLMVSERENASEKLDRDERLARKYKEENNIEVEIGNKEQVEKAQKKIRKIIPIKRKKGVLLKTAIVSENPFD